MTREEAIDLLDNLIGMVDDNHDSDYDTAIKMAIKALEQEPCNVDTCKIALHYMGNPISILPKEPCEDAVSRQAMNDLYDRYHPRLATRVYEFGEELKALPSVTPKREQGEWCEQNDDYFDWYECSECGYGSEGEMQYSSEHDVRTKYCPNCGAEMR